MNESTFMAAECWGLFMARIPPESLLFLFLYWNFLNVVVLSADEYKVWKVRKWSVNTSIYR